MKLKFPKKVNIRRLTKAIRERRYCSGNRSFKDFCYHELDMRDKTCLMVLRTGEIKSIGTYKKLARIFPEIFKHKVL